MNDGLDPARQALLRHMAVLELALTLYDFQRFIRYVHGGMPHEAKRVKIHMEHWQCLDDPSST